MTNLLIPQFYLESEIYDDFSIWFKISSRNPGTKGGIALKQLVCVGAMALWLLEVIKF
jgi:hypothetical protein